MIFRDNFDGDFGVGVGVNVMRMIGEGGIEW